MMYRLYVSNIWNVTYTTEFLSKNIFKTFLLILSTDIIDGKARLNILN